VLDQGGLYSGSDSTSGSIEGINKQGSGFRAGVIYMKGTAREEAMRATRKDRPEGQPPAVAGQDIDPRGGVKSLGRKRMRTGWGVATRDFAISREGGSPEMSRDPPKNEGGKDYVFSRIGTNRG